MNSKAEIRFENGQFVKLGEPTEAALRVAAEKIGQYDSAFGNADY